MMRSEVHDEPGDVSVDGMHVVVRCSSGLTFTLTPDAAVITSDRLLQAGLRAKRNQTDAEVSADAD